MNHTYIIAFWSLSPLPSDSICMGYFTSSLRMFGDIQCLNCQNRRDRRTLRLLRQADLVVVALRQSHREFCDYFCKNVLPVSNCLYLVVDYLPDRELSLEHFSREFRIPPSQLICIPYNPEHREIYRSSLAHRYRENGSCPVMFRDSAYFRREFERSQRMMLKALGF